MFCSPILDLWLLIFIYVFDLALCNLWPIQLFLLSHKLDVVSHASIFIMVLFFSFDGYLCIVNFAILQVSAFMVFGNNMLDRKKEKTNAVRMIKSQILQ